MLPPRWVAIRCPSCGRAIEVPRSESANTFGSQYWSDGKTVNPVSREGRPVAKCPHCGTCFWLADAERVGELTSDASAGLAWSGLADADHPTEADYFELLLQDLPLMRARYLRFKIWWDLNDKFRTLGRCEDPVSFTPEQELNLLRLYCMLQEHRPTDWLLRAEIHRELGNFERAIEICSWLGDHESFAAPRQTFSSGSG